jgi:hypothetical protein
MAKLSGADSHLFQATVIEVESENRMRAKISTSPIVMLILALALSACTRRGEVPLSMLGEDDDAICRANNVAVGSAEYVACRRDRDAIRGNAAARADKKQRDLGQYMLDHPEHK